MFDIFDREETKNFYTTNFKNNVFLLIFCSGILGEINNFYGLFKSFDILLHFLSSILFACVGLSLIYKLDNKTEIFNFSPLFTIIFTFCFSMLIGVMWEIFEYGMDSAFNLDMQKDKYVYNINSVKLDPEIDNNIVNIDNINHTIVYDKNNNKLLNLNGYLDIGLHDTMKDLIVNFIGALIFSILGYLYILNKEKI